MPTIRYDVPAYEQEYDYSCWETAAWMVWLYWQQHGAGAGPMNTLQEEYSQSQTQGLSPAKFITMGKTSGLVPIPQKTGGYTETELYTVLKKYGPLWAAGYWDDKPHVVTITGVEKGNVFYNDPNGGEKYGDTLSWFNTKRAKLPGALMARDPSAY